MGTIGRQSVIPVYDSFVVFTVLEIILHLSFFPLLFFINPSPQKHAHARANVINQELSPAARE